VHIKYTSLHGYASYYFISQEYVHFYSLLLCSFWLKTVCEGSFHFLLQNEHIGLVWSKTSWKLAQNDPCLWSAFISLSKPSFSETIVFSWFSSWKRAVYKFGHCSVFINCLSYFDAEQLTSTGENRFWSPFSAAPASQVCEFEPPF
jgi:hypothetical protein